MHDDLDRLDGKSPSSPAGTTNSHALAPGELVLGAASCPNALWNFARCVS